MQFGLHSLALRLCKTVSQLKSEMGYAEYKNWITFFEMQNKNEVPETDWDAMSKEQIQQKLGFTDG